MITFRDAQTKNYSTNAVSVYDMYGNLKFVPGVKNKKVHDANFAFLSTTLAKMHTTLVEPKYNVNYMKDIPINVGGGFVDYVEYQTVEWGAMSQQVANLFGNNGNVIPRINAALTKERVNVFTYELAYDLSFVELEKLDTIKLRKQLTDIYNNVAVASWDLFLEKLAYEGINGSKSFFNNPNVLVMSIDNTSASAANKGFVGMTDAAIVAWFNGMFEYFLVGSNLNMKILPDRILVPTFVGSDLTSRMSPLYTNTLRSFIRSHNLAVDESDLDNYKVAIESRPQLNELGVGGHGRIVAYRKDEAYVRMDMTYAFQAYMTLPDIARACYTTIFIGQASEVQLPYCTSNTELAPIMYCDFEK